MMFRKLAEHLCLSCLCSPFGAVLATDSLNKINTSNCVCKTLRWLHAYSHINTVEVTAIPPGFQRQALYTCIRHCWISHPCLKSGYDGSSDQNNNTSCPSRRISTYPCCKEGEKSMPFVWSYYLENRPCHPGQAAPPPPQEWWSKVLPSLCPSAQPWICCGSTDLLVAHSWSLCDMFRNQKFNQFPRCSLL